MGQMIRGDDCRQYRRQSRNCCNTTITTAAATIGRRLRCKRIDSANNNNNKNHNHRFNIGNGYAWKFSLIRILIGYMHTIL